jgi:WD40 repeat protein
VLRGQSFCITWTDSLSDERGFRVLLEYLRSGERFSYEVGPNTEVFAVPPADAPPLDASGEQCMARKDFMITVIALRPDGETPLDSMASEGECWLTLPESATQTGVVVYQSRGDGSVRAITLDTGVEQVLADPTDPEQLLPWAPAPDGGSIALITGHGWNGKPGRPFTAALWTVNVDESNPRKLLDLVSSAHAPQNQLEAADLERALVGQEFPHLAWTPDGKEIVLASAHEGQVDLYAVAANGSGARRLTNTAELEIYATLSPDGRELAYGSAATFGTGAGWGKPRAWVQPFAGGNGRSLLDTRSDSSSLASVRVLGWASDGSVVVQTSSNLDGSATIWVAGQSSAARAIYQGPANNLTWHQQRGALAFTNNGMTAGRQLLIWRMGDDQPTRAGEIGMAGKLAWSPDGQALLICKGELFGSDAGPNHVRLMLWNAGTLRDMGDGACDQLAWAADGRLAVGGSEQGLVVRPEGTIMRRLPEAALPTGWASDALLFLAPLEGNNRRWQLYRAIGERDEPLGAPIGLQPSEPRLVSIVNSP